MGCPSTILCSMVHGHPMLYGGILTPKPLLLQRSLKLFLPTYIPSLAVWWIFSKIKHPPFKFLPYKLYIVLNFSPFNLRVIYPLSKFQKLFPFFSLSGTYLTVCFPTFHNKYKLYIFFGLGFVTLQNSYFGPVFLN